MKSLNKLEVNKHNTKPVKVGIIIARRVHFMLPVSFFIVIIVVPHGK